MHEFANCQLPCGFYHEPLFCNGILSSPQVPSFELRTVDLSPEHFLSLDPILDFVLTFSKQRGLSELLHSGFCCPCRRMPPYVGHMRPVQG